MPKRILDGITLRDSLDKTVVVRVETQRQHKRYKKIVKYKKNYLVHDESNAIKAGTNVRIQEHIPISKRKKWIVLK